MPKLIKQHKQLANGTAQAAEPIQSQKVSVHELDS